MPGNPILQVRVSPEQRSWLYQQAAAHGLDVSEMIRRELFARMTDAVVQPSAPKPEAVIQSKAPRRKRAAVVQQQEPETPLIDVDALVEANFSNAVANGLATEHLSPEEEDRMPPAGVKALRRPPPPFAKLPGWVG